MKIAFLAPRYHTNQIPLVEFLIKKKHQVFFYVTRIGLNEDHSIIKPIILDSNIITKFLKNFINLDYNMFNYKFGLPSLKEFSNFKSNKFDLIIIRDLINIMSITYILWAKLNKVKVLIYIQREIYKKPNFSIKEIIEKFLIFLINSDCISPCLGNLKYKKSYNKFNYLPFCLNKNIFQKKWFLNDKINILTIGKFTERKKHILLIRALSKIYSDNKFKLTIVGECSTNEHIRYFNKIKNEIKKSNFQIEVYKNLNQKKIQELYKSHDIFVLASVKEPASVSNLEAMSNGLPVITTDTNNTSCYTEHNENGFIVKSNSIDNLKEKLEFLINNKDTIINFGRKSLEIVEQNHNPNKIYNKFFSEKFRI